jgi:hypothetical protein
MQGLNVGVTTWGIGVAVQNPSRPDGGVPPLRLATTAANDGALLVGLRGEVTLLSSGPSPRGEELERERG